MTDSQARTLNRGDEVRYTDEDFDLVGTVIEVSDTSIGVLVEFYSSEGEGSAFSEDLTLFRRAL